jgi:benzoyl-CoA reductase subunit C
LSGRLDCLDGLLFPAICDVIRNLSGMWQIMFEGKYVKYMDFPQNFDPSAGGLFYRTELTQLRDDLGRLSGVEVSDAAINDAIDLYNANARAIRRLYRLRADRPHLVPSYELYLLMRAGYIIDVEEHTRTLEDYMAAVEREGRKEMDNIRVVVTGVFCEQPSLGLIRALEQSGCYIVDDDWILGAHYLMNDVEVGGEPLEALVSAYLEQGTPTSSRYIANEEKGAYLVQRVRELKADGVIFASPSFCDPALLERPMLQKALAAADIPYSSFKFSENSGQFHAIKEQTGTFADSIKLWGTA